MCNIVRRIRISCIFLLLVIVCILGCACNSAPESLQEETIITENNEMKRNDLIIQDKHFILREGNAEYNIHYPWIKDNESKIAMAINDTIYDYVMGFIVDNKDNSRITLNITYDITYQDNQYITYLIKSCYIHEKAAHPDKHTVSFIYDLESGKKYKLKDFLRVNEKLVQLLFDNCRKQCSEAVYDYINNVIGPVQFLKYLNDADTNIIQFYLTDKAFVINFESYYALGNQEIQISFDDVEKIELTEKGGQFVNAKL